MLWLVERNTGVRFRPIKTLNIYFLVFGGGGNMAYHNWAIGSVGFFLLTIHWQNNLQNARIFIWQPNTGKPLCSAWTWPNVIGQRAINLHIIIPTRHEKNHSLASFETTLRSFYVPPIGTPSELGVLSMSGTSNSPSKSHTLLANIPESHYVSHYRQWRITASELERISHYRQWRITASGLERISHYRQRRISANRL